MCVYVQHVWWGQKMALHPLELGLDVAVSLPTWPRFWDLNSGFLEEQEVFLATKPLSSPLCTVCHQSIKVHGNLYGWFLPLIISIIIDVIISSTPATRIVYLKTLPFKLTTNKTATSPIIRRGKVSLRGVELQVQGHGINSVGCKPLSNFTSCILCSQARLFLQLHKAELHCEQTLYLKFWPKQNGSYFLSFFRHIL